MLKKLGLPTAVLGTVLALLSPFRALARDRDNDRDRGRHERQEWREREWRQPRFRVYFNYGPRYTNGYYDQWGYWHPYAAGYYDRWGRFHPYGY
jgi:hypothetical protein